MTADNNHCGKDYPPINMVWIGQKVSPIEYLAMNSFLMNGHSVHLYAYNPIEGIPAGVTLKDANEIVPQEKIFLHANSYAAFADLFRWHLMEKGLGYYTDTDVVCLKPFSFKETAIIGYEAENLLTPTVLRFATANHPLATVLKNAANHPLHWQPYDRTRTKLMKFRYWFKCLFNKTRYNALGWGETAGPIGVTRAYRYFEKQPNYQMSCFSPEVFYPVYYSDWETILTPNRLCLADFPETTHAIHLWNEMWRRGGVDKQGPFAAESLIGELFQRFAPEWVEKGILK